MRKLSHWALDYRATDTGSWDILQGHVDYCAQYGHATYVDADGVHREHCPRCGKYVR